MKKAEVIEPGKVYAPGPDRVYVEVERRAMEKAMGKLLRKKNAEVVVASLVEVLEKLPLASLTKLATAVQAELLLRSSDAKSKR
jgi:hypothetical protein